MLLTSSQVSIAVSSGVVVFFTSALFFSGYAIQQRTLRDLRASIKGPPRRRPEDLIFLPDRFKKMTTELEDGRVVVVEEDYPPPKQEIVVEIKPTLPVEAAVEEKEAQPKLQDSVEKSPSDSVPIVPEEPMAGDTSDSPDTSNPAGRSQEPISAAERRRRIKADIQRLSQGNERGYWQPRLY